MADVLYRYLDKKVVNVRLNDSGERVAVRRDGDEVTEIPVEQAIADGFIAVVTPPAPLEERGDDDEPLLDPPK
jgi:hypothetical protein